MKPRIQRITVEVAIRKGQRVEATLSKAIGTEKATSENLVIAHVPRESLRAPAAQTKDNQRSRTATIPRGRSQWAKKVSCCSPEHPGDTLPKWRFSRQWIPIVRSARRTSDANIQPAVKSRTIPVRLISMAMTGYFRTMVRPRTHRPLSMLKYDPVVKKKVLFLEHARSARKQS